MIAKLHAVTRIGRERARSLVRFGDFTIRIARNKSVSGEQLVEYPTKLYADKIYPVISEVPRLSFFRGGGGRKTSRGRLVLGRAAVFATHLGINEIARSAPRSCFIIYRVVS